MLAAHALDALDRAEAREMDTHLAGCAECQAEFDSWLETSAALAHTVPASEPSADLRSRILESLRAEGPVRASRTAPGIGLKVESPKASAALDESNVVQFAKPARRAWSAASKVFALAASVAFIALIVSLILLWNRYNDARQDLARLSDRLNQMQGELKSERETLARERQTLSRERETLAMLTSPETRINTLTGTEMATNARAMFALDRSTGRAMLMAYDLPPAPEGKAYQLWYIAEGKPPMPGHVFNVDAAGHAEMHDQVPVEARAATVFAVTLEPSPGVTAPTGPKVLLSAAS